MAGSLTSQERRVLEYAIRQFRVNPSGLVAVDQLPQTLGMPLEDLEDAVDRLHHRQLISTTPAMGAKHLFITDVSPDALGLVGEPSDADGGEGSGR